MLAFDQMTELWILLNPFNLALDKGQDVLFHTLIVGFDSLFEIIGAIFVCELCDDGNGLIRLHLRGNLGRIHHNLSVEDFLLDTLVEVIGHCPHEHALCEVGDFGSRDKAIELRGDRGRLVIELDSDEPTVQNEFLKQTFIKRRYQQNPSDLQTLRVPVFTFDHILCHQFSLFSVQLMEYSQKGANIAHQKLKNIYYGVYLQRNPNNQQFNGQQ